MRQHTPQTPRYLNYFAQKRVKTEKTPIKLMTRAY